MIFKSQSNLCSCFWPEIRLCPRVSSLVERNLIHKSLKTECKILRLLNYCLGSFFDFLLIPNSNESLPSTFNVILSYISPSSMNILWKVKRIKLQRANKVLTHFDEILAYSQFQPDIVFLDMAPCLAVDLSVSHLNLQTFRLILSLMIL